MKLGDGTAVFFPEDILPVVPQESESARYVHSSLDKRETASMLSIGVAVSVAAAVALFYAGTQTSEHEHRGLYTAGMVGSAVSAVGLEISVYFVRKSASNDAIDAYRTYDDALQDRLGICIGARCGPSVIRDLKKEP